MSGNQNFRITPLAAAISSALLIGASGPALAQDQALEEITVTGIRGSLRSSMNMKRDAVGVVDAISAEDIGKFPDTNLAESMQRITGVSIDRQNGEGSQVTVRGFGPGYNLVTLNGRTMPTAEVNIIGNRNNYAGGNGRSFDFSNIASEGVSALEIYKTGQAVLPSGGIGATINIETIRPLNAGGTQGTFGVKALADTSVGEGDSVTPEVTGLYSYVNDDNTFGVSLFGAYSQRDSGAGGGTVNDWEYRRGPGIDTGMVRADGSTQSNDIPGDDELYFIPQDSRYDFSDITRERINAQLVVQFQPTDALMLTADYTYVENQSEQFRYEQTNWYARPFDQITFSDYNGEFLYMTELQENNDGTKDIGYEQTRNGSKDDLDSFGLNLEWELTDSASLRFDGHTSSAGSVPDNPLGHTSTFVAIGAPVVSQHSTDYATEIPQQFYEYDDTAKGNGNGILDVGDLATQVARTSSQWQEMDVDELDLRFSMEGDGSRFDVGVNYRATEIFTRGLTTQQDLGTWGLAVPGDVEQFAPGVVEEFCLSCEFSDYDVSDATVGFRGDAVALFEAMTAAYTSTVSTSDTQNWLDEDILSFYAQFELESELINLPLRVSGGLRYETTDLKATARQTVPTQVRWTADNDFVIDYTADLNDVPPGEGDYDNLLPNLDFRLDITDEIVARLSYSQTIARVPYGNLSASASPGAPNRPTALGGTTGGTSQNPALLPLESENFDLSAEWYYDDASYVSVGYFDKKVENFLGTGIDVRPLFGLLDPTAGADGSRSGDALQILQDIGADQSDPHLFTLVALIDANGGDRAAAQAEFEANAVNGALPQNYVDEILGLYDVVADSADPEMLFRVSQPVNTETGHIKGWEIAWQHFLGDTGFGFAANYTMVDGDVDADPASDPDQNFFALVGLSDSANLSIIYENYGFAGRVSYNWRDEFLNATNQGASRAAQFTEEHGQIDASISYDLNDNLQFTFEGINLNGENTRQYRRIPQMLYHAYELEPRYSFGARYRF